MDFSTARISGHALEQMAFRALSEAQVREVLTSFEQKEELSSTRLVLQKVFWEDRKLFLLRVFVDIDSEPPVVVTVYKTSKLQKYGAIGGRS